MPDIRYEKPEPHIAIRVVGAASLAMLALAACRGDARDPPRSSPTPSLEPEASYQQNETECLEEAEATIEARFGMRANEYLPTDLYDDVSYYTDKFRLLFPEDPEQPNAAEREEVSAARDFEQVTGERSYQSSEAIDAFIAADEAFEACMTSRRLEAQPLPNYYGDARHCLTVAVWAVFQRYGGTEPFEYTQEFNFILDAVEEENDPPEISVDEANAIAARYEQEFGKSPYRNPEALALVAAEAERCMSEVQ